MVSRREVIKRIGLTVAALAVMPKNLFAQILRGHPTLPYEEKVFYLSWNRYFVALGEEYPAIDISLKSAPGEQICSQCGERFDQHPFEGPHSPFRYICGHDMWAAQGLPFPRARLIRDGKCTYHSTWQKSGTYERIEAMMRSVNTLSPLETDMRNFPIFTRVD
jgi:hypothetical protein